jgi:hypothetical protein
MNDTPKLNKAAYGGSPGMTCSVSFRLTWRREKSSLAIIGKIKGVDVARICEHTGILSDMGYHLEIYGVGSWDESNIWKCRKRVRRHFENLPQNETSAGTASK